MRITVVESSVDGGACCMDAAEVKQENEQSSFNQGTSESESSTLSGTMPLIESHYSTRGIKVRYVSDGDEDDYDSNGNTKKKHKMTGVKASRVTVKKEARDNNSGVYQPSKKKIYRKVDPNRCQDCRQRLDDPNLKVNKL